MQSVVETPTYLRDARSAGLTEAEMAAIVNVIAANPEAGVVMQGTGGCRKVRFAMGGKGKSGGARVITFYTGAMLPVFLLTVFGHGEKLNLTKAERNDLAALTKRLVDTYAMRSAR